MIANGIFSSKLIFQISVWGGAESYLLDALQIVQNKAARFVARGERFTPVIDLLKQCGWLSVRQLAFYHSVVLIKKTLHTTYPKYLYDKLTLKFPYNTRLADSSSVRMGSELRARLDLTERSFINRATSSYNKLPATLREATEIKVFT